MKFIDIKTKEIIEEGGVIVGTDGSITRFAKSSPKEVYLDTGLYELNEVFEPLTEFQVQGDYVDTVDKTAKVVSRLYPAIDKTPEEITAIKIEKLKDVYDAQIRTMTEAYPRSERETWLKQELQARAWIADTTANTPFLDALLAARNNGETKAELCLKIVTKAEQLEAAVATLTGERQSAEAALLGV